MRTMTATEASRNFAAVLDSAEHGETIVVTRGGRRIATVSPAPKAGGKALKDALRPLCGEKDDDWGRDWEKTRELLTGDSDPWDE
ncbi:type II toxin-antitoxin system Phd/YefM family antitoxin [Streptomyces sp. NPDC058471]|uniref:type II toxin-antitoxin system Phd/YefM family antitoxin n=1 Tax=Streptomyces sp. NPDC058471 TaxID=3346516 RepID=UPI00366A0DD6